MQTPAQQLIAETHETLRRNVVEFKNGLEAAVKALTAFESAYGIQAAPKPQEQAAPPAPRPVTTSEPQRADEDRGTNKDGSARKKPGPAKGVNVNKKATQARAKTSAKAAQPAKTKKKAAAAKTKAKAAAKAVSKPGPKPGSKRDNVPSLIKAIQMVMGRKTMNADEVHAALKQKGWLPASSDQLGYIRYTLSKNKDIFLRVEGRRGHYYLDQNNPFVNGKSVEKKNGKAETAEAAPPKAEVSEATEAVVDEVDDLLAKSGVDISGPNPFADQSAS